MSVGFKHCVSSLEQSFNSPKCQKKHGHDYHPFSLSSLVYKHWSNHAPGEIDSHTTANCLGPSAGNIDPEK